MTNQLWKFEAIDTLFFRESRPFDTIGGTQLKSTFPPPVRTIVGAIRTAIGEANGVNWHRYQKSEEYESLRQSMGNAHGFGNLDFRGPFIMAGGERLYPAPLLLLEGAKESSTFYRLKPGDKPVRCDLGNLRLPILDNAERGAKPLENCWLTRNGLEKVLLGGVPNITDIYESDFLYHEEDRLGIARDHQTRSNIDELIYRTRHIRPNPDISIGIYMKGLDEAFHENLQNGVNKLGGEGRLGTFETTKAQDAGKSAKFNITVPSDDKKVLLTLLTAGDFEGDWVPPGFQKTTESGCDVWIGEINEVPLRIVSTITGKPLREGGWDMANRKSRPLKSMVPAGSCYFCEVMDDSEYSAQQAIDRLQGYKIGEDTQIGRGELAVGYW